MIGSTMNVAWLPPLKNTAGPLRGEGLAQGAEVRLVGGVGLASLEVHADLRGGPAGEVVEHRKLVVGGLVEGPVNQGVMAVRGGR
jgi:hypothetical protein